MALIVNGGKKRLDEAPPTDSWHAEYDWAKQGARQYLKAKALRCVGPDHAASLGLPAEAPVFVSPYISTANVCPTCRARYTPLIYQVDHLTEAQHFCKRNGGIYVRLIEDVSGKWVYENDLWDAIAVPYGPIRMGNDRGFQFERVKLIRMVAPKCFACGGVQQVDLDPNPTTVSHGMLATNGHASDSATLVPVCDRCVANFHPNGYNELTPWTWRYDGTTITFSQAHKATMTYEDFMLKTQPKRLQQRDGDGYQ